MSFFLRVIARFGSYRRDIVTFIQWLSKQKAHAALAVFLYSIAVFLITIVSCDGEVTSECVPERIAQFKEVYDVFD